MKCARMVLPVLATLAFAAGLAVAADLEEVPFEEGKIPPEGKDGEAWCLVTKPAKYKTVTEQVQIRPATFYYEVLPPKYEPKEERIMVEPEKKQAVVIPAQYKTEMVRQLVKEESTKYEIVPAQYEWIDEQVVVQTEREAIDVQAEQYRTETETVMVEPPRIEWRKVECDDKKVIIHRRETKDDCYTLVEIPAKYQNIAKVVKAGDTRELKRGLPAVSRTVKVCKLVKDAEVKKVVVPAEYREVEKQVVVTPSRVEYETIPARYVEVRKMVQVGEPGKTRVDVPAKTETITKEVMEEPAQMVWRKVRSNPVKKYGSVPGGHVK